MIRIAVVDDQALVRAGFRMICEAEDDFTVVGEAGDGLEGVVLVERSQPDVVLMDIRMPTMDGVEACAQVTRRHPDARVLMLTTFDLDDYVFAALRAGASGFLLKDTPPEVLVDAIRIVASGESLLAPSVTRRLIERFVEQDRPAPSTAARGLDMLTDRELEVLRLVARGLANAEIATSPYLGEATVKTHVGRVLSKLGLRDRVQAVVAAYESGIVTPGAA